MWCLQRVWQLTLNVHRIMPRMHLHQSDTWGKKSLSDFYQNCVIVCLFMLYSLKERYNYICNNSGPIEWSQGQIGVTQGLTDHLVSMGGPPLPQLSCTAINSSFTPYRCLSDSLSCDVHIWWTTPILHGTGAWSISAVWLHFCLEADMSHVQRWADYKLVRPLVPVTSVICLPWAVFWSSSSFIGPSTDRSPCP